MRTFTITVTLGAHDQDENIGLSDEVVTITYYEVPADTLDLFFDDIENGLERLDLSYEMTATANDEIT